MKELQCHPDPARKLYDIYHCYVYSKITPDDGQRNCPKHVEFHSEKKFEKLVHTVDFIIRKNRSRVFPVHAPTLSISEVSLA
jgi:hypothetical protein